MSIRFQGLTAFAAALLTSSAFAQTSFPEIEPNSNKVEATAVTGIVAGDSINGTSTGTSTTALSTLVTTADVYRVKTGVLPAGIYEHRLTLTSAVVGHTGTIRGLNQTGTAGTASTGGTVGTTDTTIQTTITTSTPPRFNQWYGFGKQEEIYYRVAGTAATTASYDAVMSTTAVTPTVIATPFESGTPITITTQGQTTVDTELLLYDSTFTAVPTGLNDDAFLAPNTQSTLTRTLPAGTYYLAVATFELCSNQVSPPDDDYVNGFMMDFPDCVVLSSSSTLAQDYDFQIRACNGTHTQANTTAAGNPYKVTWFQFTTALGAPAISAPANDNCASATALTSGVAVAGNIGTATNDGSSSIDPGSGSKDVWYSFNGGANGGTLAVNTCTTSGVDTSIAVFASCGGTELAVNDDCGGAPCGGTSSCVSAVAVGVGQTVLIRVSDKGLGGCFVTTTATFVANPPANDLCANSIALNGFGTFPINNFGATTGPEGQAEALCNFFGGTAVRQDVWYTWTATNSGSVTITTCGLIATGPSQDSKIAVYNGAGCPTAAAIACIDDATCTGFSGLNATVSFTAVCGNSYTFQIGMYQGTALTMSGSFSVTGAGPACSTPFTVFCDGSAVGTTCLGCGNNGAANKGCANSGFPGGTQLVSGGIASVGTDTLTLTTTDMTGPGLFFQSNGLAASPITFGDGMLCASVGIARLGVVFPTSGSATYPGGLTPAPITVAGGPIAAGDTKHYQCWYRDTPVFCTASTFNLSNGVTLVWGP